MILFVSLGVIGAFSACNWELDKDGKLILCRYSLILSSVGWRYEDHFRDYRELHSIQKIVAATWGLVILWLREGWIRWVILDLAFATLTLLAKYLPALFALAYDCTLKCFKSLSYHGVRRILNSSLNLRELEIVGVGFCLFRDSSLYISEVRVLNLRL